MGKQRRLETKLAFYWYEPASDKDDLRDERWAHLIGATHSLNFAIEELRQRSKLRYLSRALEQVAYHLENYLARAYELRERLLALLSAVSGRPDLVKKMKKGKLRQGAAAQLAGFLSPEVIAVATELLDAMEDDLLLRNLHTHKTAAHLGIFVDGDMYDPGNAVDFMRGTDEEKRALRRFFRREIRKTIAEYNGRATTLVDLTMRILDLLDRAKLYAPT